MADGILDGLGPILGEASRVGGLVLTIVVCFRLFNSTWATAARTLRESADYSRDENAELRARIDELEKKTAAQARDIDSFAVERASWVLERANLERHIADLEASVARLEQQISQQRKGYPE